MTVSDASSDDRVGRLRGRLRSWRWLARMGMMRMMAGLIRLIKIIRLIEFIRFIKVISLIAVDADQLVRWQIGVVVI